MFKVKNVICLFVVCTIASCYWGNACTYYLKDRDLTFKIIEKDSFSILVLDDTDSIFMPKRCWSSDLFLKLYGETGIDTYNRFRNVFFDEMEKNGRKKTIKLTSGEIVNITYFELKGVFIQLDKEISFSYGLNKEDNPKVNSPFIPIAITEINHGGQFLIENDYRE